MRLLQHIAYFTALYVMGRDRLSMRSSVAGAIFMNEFTLYEMQALPLMRRTRQRFTEIDFHDPGMLVLLHSPVDIHKTSLFLNI